MFIKFILYLNEFIIKPFAKIILINMTNVIYPSKYVPFYNLE